MANDRRYYLNNLALIADRVDELYPKLTKTQLEALNKAIEALWGVVCKRVKK